MATHRHGRFILVCFGVSAVMPSCIGDPYSPTWPGPAPLLTLVQVESGPQSNVSERGFRAIADQESLRELHRRIHSHGFGSQELPEVDFGSQIVLVAFMGQRSTAGHRIGFGGAAAIGNRTARILIVETRPSLEASVGQMMTTPYAIAALERGDYEEIVFVDQEGAVIHVASATGR